MMFGGTMGLKNGKTTMDMERHMYSVYIYIIYYIYYIIYYIYYIILYIYILYYIYTQQKLTEILINTFRGFLDPLAKAQQKSMGPGSKTSHHLSFRNISPFVLSKRFAQDGPKIYGGLQKIVIETGIAQIYCGIIECFLQLQIFQMVDLPFEKNKK